MIAKTLWFAVFVSGLNQTAVIASGQSTPDPNQIARRFGFPAPMLGLSRSGR
jgi:hypothetical protein